MCYLDIGAFHPKMISNTHLLHTIGFKGKVIDLDEFKLKLFKRNRKNFINYKVAAIVPGYTTKKSNINVYKFNKPFSELDTLDFDVAKKREVKFKLKYKKVQVEQIGINNLLKEENFDFVNIDIEGLDERMMLSIDFKNIYHPKLIVFEVYNPLSDNSCYNFLEKNGYCHLFTTGGSVGYHKKF